jgi:hypothetical protein
MAHLWQARFGKQVRQGYHDKQWAAKMIEIGLVPSSTGAPGGKPTGYHMDHYIVDGGPFDLSYQEFEATGQTIGWGDAIAHDDDKPAKPKRLKFCCSRCGQSVYGAPSTAVRCIPCDVVMTASGGE